MPVLAYRNSKVPAHWAVTDWIARNQAHIDVIRIVPGVIIGANELVTDAHHVSDGSHWMLIAVALGQLKERPKLTGQVHLDDVAKAHILANSKEFLGLDQNKATDRISKYFGSLKVNLDATTTHNSRNQKSMLLPSAPNQNTGMDSR